MKFTFKEDNNIPYIQDFDFKKDIPANVEFNVETWYVGKKDKRYKLTAPGYSDLSKPNQYENGKIGLFAKDLKNKKHLYTRKNK